MYRIGFLQKKNLCFLVKIDWQVLTMLDIAQYGAIGQISKRNKFKKKSCPIFRSFFS